MIDMHCHILYGIDDGCKTIEESIETIRNMKSVGFNTIVLTPHYIEEYYENKKDIIDFISSRTSDDEEYLNGMTNDDLKKYFFNVCIKEQISRNEFKNNMKNYKRQPITFEEDLKEETNKEEENEHEEIGNDGESERRTGQENRQTNNRGRKSKAEK